MDYEKAYNEAIKRAKAIIEVAEKEEEVYKSAITIFPELKESKDERVRESLLEYLHTLPNHYSHNGVCAPEWIVWLEKQGGQKPAKWSLGDERVIAIINNALTESNTPPDDYDKVYDWLESLRQRI